MSMDQKMPQDSTKSFSFGPSRDKLQKLHIDKIQDQAKKGILPPSCDLYQSSKSTFESIEAKITIGMRRHYDRRLAVPGPGHYSPPSLSGRFADKV